MAFRNCITRPGDMALHAHAHTAAVAGRFQVCPKAGSLDHAVARQILPVSHTSEAPQSPAAVSKSRTSNSIYRIKLELTVAFIH